MTRLPTRMSDRGVLLNEESSHRPVYAPTGPNHNTFICHDLSILLSYTTPNLCEIL